MTALIHPWTSVFELPGSLWGLFSVGRIHLPRKNKYDDEEEQQRLRQQQQQRQAADVNDVIVTGEHHPFPTKTPRGADQVTAFYDTFVGLDALNAVQIEFLVVAPTGRSQLVDGGGDSVADTQDSAPEIWRCNNTIQEMLESRGGLWESPAEFLSILRHKFLDVRPNFRSLSRKAGGPPSTTTMTTTDPEHHQPQQSILVPAFPDTLLPPPQYSDSWNFTLITKPGAAAGGNGGGGAGSDVSREISPVPVQQQQQQMVKTEPGVSIKKEPGLENNDDDCWSEMQFGHVTLQEEEQQVSYDNLQSTTGGDRRRQRDDHQLQLLLQQEKQQQKVKPETLAALRAPESKMTVTVTPSQVQDADQVTVDFFREMLQGGRRLFAGFKCIRCSGTPLMASAMQLIMQHTSLLFLGAVTLRTHEHEVQDRAKSEIDKARFTRNQYKQKEAVQLAQFCEILNEKKVKLIELRRKVGALERTCEEYHQALEEAKRNGGSSSFGAAPENDETDSDDDDDDDFDGNLDRFGTGNDGAEMMMMAASSKKTSGASANGSSNKQQSVKSSAAAAADDDDDDDDDDEEEELDLISARKPPPKKKGTASAAFPGSSEVAGLNALNAAFTNNDDLFGD